MKVVFDADGKVNYDRIGKSSTVKDLLDAVDIFLYNNPLVCCECKDSCCRKSWSVAADNIFVNRLCNLEYKSLSAFISSKLVRKQNYYRDFFQFVLKKDRECKYLNSSGRCLVYGDRPLVCRLYVCYENSIRFNLLREIAGSAFIRALVFEYRITGNKCSPRTAKMYKKNPAVFAGGYNVPLDGIIQYAEEKGWVDASEKQLLYEILP